MIVTYFFFIDDCHYILTLLIVNNCGRCTKCTFCTGFILFCFICVTFLVILITNRRFKGILATIFSVEMLNAFAQVSYFVNFQNVKKIAVNSSKSITLQIDCITAINHAFLVYMNKMSEE